MILMKDNLTITQEFSNKLFKLRWLSKKHFAEELTCYQLTPAQYVAMRALEGHPDGLKMSELAKQAQQVSATMTGVVDRLEKQNLVSRVRCGEDRRRVFVTLTESGITLLAQIKASKLSKFEELMLQLSPNEQEMVFRVMDKAIDYFSENLRGTS